MRRLYQLSMLCLAAGIVNACKPEEVVQTEDIPTAGIRFLHAVPDTGSLDFRPVDIVENSTFYATAFRSTTLLFYKNARAGARHFRIFLNSPEPQFASQVLKDTTFTLVQGHRYTFVLWGFARTGQTPPMKLDIIDDDPADPGTQVALRVINAAAGLGNLDVKQYPSTGAPPGTPTWAAVQPLTASAYVSAAPGTIKYNVTPAGGGAALFADPTAPTGIAAAVDIEAVPGTTIAGSAVTGIIFPRSVAGSAAANFTTPAMIFVWDRRPPRTCSPLC